MSDMPSGSTTRQAGPEAATKRQTLEYIESTAAALADLAKGKRFVFISYLLRVAALQARNELEGR